MGYAKREGNGYNATIFQRRYCTCNSNAPFSHTQAKSALFSTIALSQWKTARKWGDQLSNAQWSEKSSHHNTKDDCILPVYSIVGMKVHHFSHTQREHALNYVAYSAKVDISHGNADNDSIPVLKTNTQTHTHHQAYTHMKRELGHCAGTLCM